MSAAEGQVSINKELMDTYGAEIRETEKELAKMDPNSEQYKITMTGLEAMREQYNEAASDYYASAKEMYEAA
jgi:hypothetical protein